MALKLYFHPLASFCHKALIALYENRIPFEPIIVDLGDEASRAAFRAVWPMAKMPVLRDEARNRTVAESTIIIEFLDAHYQHASTTCRSASHLISNGLLRQYFPRGTVLSRFSPADRL